LGVGCARDTGAIRTGCAEKRTAKVDLGDLNAVVAVARAAGFAPAAAPADLSDSEPAA